MNPIQAISNLFSHRTTNNMSSRHQVEDDQPQSSHDDIGV